MFIRLIITFVIAWSFVFFTSVLLHPLVMAYDIGEFKNDFWGQGATGLFMSLNFPLWIIGKGAEIFRVDHKDLYTFFALNSIFYALAATGYLYIKKEKKKQVVVSKGGE